MWVYHHWDMYCTNYCFGETVLGEKKSSVKKIIIKSLCTQLLTYEKSGDRLEKRKFKS